MCLSGDSCRDQTGFKKPVLAINSSIANIPVDNNKERQLGTECNTRNHI